MTEEEYEINNEIDDEDQQTDEEYRIWKKNSPYIYDILITHNLDWPSLTVDWLPISR